MPGTLCGQPADGPRPPALRLCMLRVFKLNFTQLGSSWHATLGLNGLCVAVFTGMGAKPLSSAGRLLGVWLSPCAEVAGFLRVPRTRGRSRDVCFMPGARGPRLHGGCWWEANNKFWLSACQVPTAHTGAKAWTRLRMAVLPTAHTRLINPRGWADLPGVTLGCPPPKHQFSVSDCFGNQLT